MPPTRPGFTLNDAAGLSFQCKAKIRSGSLIDSSRQTGVAIRRWSSACSIQIIFGQGLFDHIARV